jgi:glycosyltransferase involved in cell wall biosynthesis
MDHAPAPATPVKQALRLLQQKQPVEQALMLLDQVAEGDPDFATAQHLRGVCAARSGDARRAIDLYIDAIARGEASGSVCLNLAQATADAGFPDKGLAALLGFLPRISPPQAGAFATKVLATLGFASQSASPGKDIVFEKLALPLLATFLSRRHMDAAVELENRIYEWHAKTIETEDHFAAVMGRLEPLFTEAGHHWRNTLPPLARTPLEPPYKVGFFIHNASMLAHIEVLLNTLKGYRQLDTQPFEPTVYCYSGKSEELEQALAAIDVPLVMLNERFPDTGPWARLLRLRELIAADGVHQLVWISLVTMMPLVFGMRIAPVQTWFAMKYRNYSQPDIDGYVSGSALTRFGTLSGRRFRTAMLGVDDWYDASLEGKAAAMRAQLGDRVVLLTLGRTEKMRDPAYLAAMAEILKAHPKAIFLWAGREKSAWVTDAFREAGVLEQTKFVGWVNTRLFAQVCDIFLDTFPFPCGFTLFQAMAAGKAVVAYGSPESAQTGLWNFIKPLVEDGEGTPQERAELVSIVGDDDTPLIPVARSPQDYARHAGRLIEDLDARAKSADASRAFMARYFSDPRVMGQGLADHFMELIEERRALQEH